MTAFEAAYAAAYDPLYGDKDYSAECDMIEALLFEFGSVRPIRRVLDLGCGTGSHAIELAMRGYEVTGVDCSSAMIARARAKVAAWGRPCVAVFQQGDIRYARLGGARYEGAIMMFGVLSYQQRDKDVRSAMRTARTHLVAGAACVFDVWYGPGVLAQRPQRRQRVVETPTGKIVRRAEPSLDEASRVCTVRYHIDRWVDETLVESTTEQHVMRFFFPDEFDRIASDSGFACLGIRSLPDWRLPPNDRTWSVVCVFRAV
jgi:SAM-dependent methyltransferase